LFVIPDLIGNPGLFVAAFGGLNFASGQFGVRRGGFRVGAGCRPVKNETRRMHATS
jgi:hypothetical protein